MAQWQFFKNGDDISHEHFAEVNADRVSVLDTDNSVIVAAEYDDTRNGWCINASDHYHEWSEYADEYYDTFQDAIQHMFLDIDHDHEPGNTQKVNGVEWVECDLCGVLFEQIEQED